MNICYLSLLSNMNFAQIPRTPQETVVKKRILVIYTTAFVNQLIRSESQRLIDAGFLMPFEGSFRLPLMEGHHFASAVSVISVCRVHCIRSP